MGGKLHLKLNTGERPIANKYREGKMQSTLKRESKGLEIVNREAIVSSIHTRGTQAVALLGARWCARCPHGWWHCWRVCVPAWLAALDAWRESM